MPASSPLTHRARACLPRQSHTQDKWRARQDLQAAERSSLAAGLLHRRRRGSHWSTGHPSDARPQHCRAPDLHAGRAHRCPEHRTPLPGRACRAAPVHRWGRCPECAGQASFCSSSRAPLTTNSHSLRELMKRALLPGSSCSAAAALVVCPRRASGRQGHRPRRWQSCPRGVTRGRVQALAELPHSANRGWRDVELQQRGLPALATQCLLPCCWGCTFIHPLFTLWGSSASACTLPLATPWGSAASAAARQLLCQRACRVRPPACPCLVSGDACFPKQSCAAQCSCAQAGSDCRAGCSPHGARLHGGCGGAARGAQAKAQVLRDLGGCVVLAALDSRGLVRPGESHPEAATGQGSGCAHVYSWATKTLCDPPLHAPHRVQHGSSSYGHSSSAGQGKLRQAEACVRGARPGLSGLRAPGRRWLWRTPGSPARAHARACRT